MASTVTYLDAQSLRSSKNEASGAIFAPQDELPIAKKDSPPGVLPRASPCLSPEKKNQAWTQVARWQRFGSKF